MNSIVRNGVMLGGFAIITTGLIASTFYGTKDKIEQQQRQRLLSILNEIVPSDLYNNSLYADCTIVSSPALGNTEPHMVYRARFDGEPVALAIETTAPNGYSGNIELVVGVNTDMTVLGVRAVDHKETPGLGDKIERSVSNWITTFEGEAFSADNQQKWQVKKDGGEFDQFTGATITPRAVVGAVKNTLLFVKQNQQSLFSQTDKCPALDTREETNND